MTPHAANISVVIPVCNEEFNVPVIIAALKSSIGPTGHRYRIIFIDDGSTDRTLDVLKQQASENDHVFYLSLSRNFGHQNALKAGLDMADGDCAIMMDGDMQHPPELIPEMIAHWEGGYDIVYTIRRDHKEIPLLKRKTSDMFYHLINNLSDIELEAGTADFRLIDRKVADVFRNFTETDLFMRGLVKWMGFKQLGLEYDPAQRKTGKSKYTVKRMIRFAIQGITSFSTRPLYIAVYLGFIFSLISVLFIPYVIYSYFFGETVSGWTSVIVAIVFFGGLQLMILGIIGMYLGKLFMQSKQRPHYIIKESNLR